ncbi:hypothetical protein T05_3097 [Trichinella murrelli]|uniref:Uncharacterized protein n=1 Tax=Trichinella murrelli TaxID=144512 RepID=A0A0V0SUV7_9BILA|nr:hypothetical protein T05_16122 [Trichinella murrelli]KRX32315.1 hypothetical protein T05_3097 [Trichinella murrelli]
MSVRDFSDIPLFLPFLIPSNTESFIDVPCIR